MKLRGTTLPKISWSPKIWAINTPIQMKMLGTSPRKPRRFFGAISPRYIGTTLRDIPIAAQQKNTKDENYWWPYVTIPVLCFPSLVWTLVISCSVPCFVVLCSFSCWLVLQGVSDLPRPLVPLFSLFVCVFKPLCFSFWVVVIVEMFSVSKFLFLFFPWIACLFCYY